MTPKRVESIPPYSSLAVEEAFKSAGLRSLLLSSSLDDLYSPLFRQYRAELQGHFYQHYSDSIDQKTKKPVWDMSIARKRRTIPVLTESFKDLADSSNTEAARLLDEELADELEESYEYALWGIYQNGIDIPLEESSLGDFDAKKLLLIAAGVAGLSYLDRLKVASSVAKGRFMTWLRATISGGRSIDDTLQGYDAITNSLQTRVKKLAENETHRALVLGSDQASHVFRAQLFGQVWLARPDSCETCLPLNLTITAMLPISDTHPGCRCYKVPMPIEYSGRPTDYVSFLQSIGRR